MVYYEGMQGEGKSYTPTAPRALRKILIVFYKLLLELMVVSQTPEQETTLIQADSLVQGSQL